MTILRATLFSLALLSALAVSPALHAADGDLDPTFDGGTVRHVWGSDAATATELEPLAGGELLVGGTVDGPRRWAVAKFYDDGTLDIGWATTFTPFGFGNEGATAAGDVYDLARDGSDRTLLLGWVEAGAGFDRPALARLTAAGALDPTFDGNGLDIVSPPPAGWTSLRVIDGKFLPDGGSVFVGSCEDCPTAGRTSAFIAKRLASGAADTSFSGDGWLSFTSDLDADNAGVAVALDENGRILVVGGVNGFPLSEYFLARVTATGAFDGSFGGGDGITEASTSGSLPRVRDVAIEPASGRIALALRLSSGDPREGAVEVFTAAGLEDTTFSGDGHIDLDLEEGSSIDAVAFQSDGKLLAAGNIDANGTQAGGFFLARLTTTGALDASFDGNGVKRVEFDAAPDVDDGALVVTTWGGRLLAAGFAGPGSGDPQAFALLRTQNSLIFADDFERGTVGGWPGF